jgi:hypothetical protein
MNISNNKKEIYSVLRGWIDISKEKSLNKFSKFRLRYGELEFKTFGSISEMVKNPLAMKYDKIRNSLVKYSRNWEEKYLESALNFFLELPKP